jgi:hypothetical protein
MANSSINDVSNILGMASLLNNEEIDNSINAKSMEREFIQSNLELETPEQTDLLNYNPINEYNSVLENLIDTSSINDEPSTLLNDNINDNDNADNEESELDDLLSYTQNNNYEQNSFEYKLTQEQQNQKFVDSIVESNNISTYNIEDENREDLKLTLLEKIDNLTEELEDDGIALDKIPKVDYHSNLEQIEYVAKLLMLKANRNRYATLGEEFILALASGLEILCNGERELLGVKPDLQGYSDVVKVKLRRLRNETSQIVGGVVEKYEISPLTTLLIELIPSLFLHSKRRKNQSYDTLYNDLSDDINEISKYN